MSQNFYKGPGSFSVKFRKNIKRKITKSYTFFVIKKKKKKKKK